MKYSIRPLVWITASLFLFSAAVRAESDYAVKLKSGILEPQKITQLPARAATIAGAHVLIQFDNPVSESDRLLMKSQGIELLEYVPNQTWVAKVDRSLTQADLTEHGIRWFDRISPDQKLSRLLTLGIGQYARRGGDSVQFVVVVHKDEDAKMWSERFTNQFGARIIGIEPSTNAIELIAPESAYHLMSELDAVIWIETAKPEPQEDNNSCRDNLGVTTVQAAPYNLNGSGVIVAEWDGGLVYSPHPDFSSRVTELDASAYSDHSTHVAGTVMGDGTASGGTYRGMAPAADLLSQQWWNSASQAFTEYSQVINSMGARISTNSWGYGVTPVTQSECQSILGTYFTEDATLDNLVREAPAYP